MVVISGKEAVAVDENTALVTVKVSPSKKGRGVFAARNIPPYEFLAATKMRGVDGCRAASICA